MKQTVRINIPADLASQLAVLKSDDQTLTEFVLRLLRDHTEAPVWPPVLKTK